MCPKNNCIFLYCNQISLCLKYGREKRINEICTCQGHIYLVCFIFLQFAKHKLRNDTVCYTPLLLARGILTLQATEF